MASYELVTRTDRDGWTDDAHGEACESDDRQVMCTGCGELVPRDAAHYGQVAATYSGTLWYCPKCWELEQGEA